MKALDRGKIGERRLVAEQEMEALLLQGRLDGAQPIGSLWMTKASVMVKTGGMGKEEGGH